MTTTAPAPTEHEQLVAAAEDRLDALWAQHAVFVTRDLQQKITRAHADLAVLTAARAAR